MEKKVNGKAPWDPGAEVQSPKRNIIRVESEETQDYVRDSLNLSQEDAEEISFVPSALSIPRGPMFLVRQSDPLREAAVTKPSDSGSLLR